MADVGGRDEPRTVAEPECRRGAPPITVVAVGRALTDPSVALEVFEDRADRRPRLADRVADLFAVESVRSVGERVKDEPGVCDEWWNLNTPGNGLHRPCQIY